MTPFGYGVIVSIPPLPAIAIALPAQEEENKDIIPLLEQA